MSPKKYFFNEETGQYEPKRVSFWKLLGNIFLVMTLGLGFALLFAFQFYKLVEPPEQKQLRLENATLMEHYPSLLEQLEKQEVILEAIEERDLDMHRVILESEPENEKEIREQQLKLSDLQNPRYMNALAKEYLYKVDTTAYVVEQIGQLVQQMDTVALDSLVQRIPSIQPIQDRSITSGFGYRIHPIYKIRKFNYGVDYQCTAGTPIYATADGEIVFAKNKGGHGLTVIIDHQNGYVTWYTHMKKIKIKRGEIKTGQVIGYVGNTGVSISPHLHYEIHYNGKAVNPISYFFRELSPSEMESVASLKNSEHIDVK